MKLHEQEYRLYRTFWTVIPVAIVVIVFTLPVFRKPPDLRIVVVESQPDHLLKTNESLALHYMVEGMDEEDLQPVWTFGDEVLVWGETPPDSCEVRLRARLDWGAGEPDSLGIQMMVRYDTLEPQPGNDWVPVISVQDTAPKVIFPKAGRYRFKVELIDTTCDSLVMVQEKLIEVVPAPKENPRDTIVRIIGPSRGRVGEELVFSATGSKVNFWYWKFGDGKHQDDDRPLVVYRYSQKGKYKVQLKTDNPDQWFTHWVEIFPKFDLDSIPDVPIDSSAYWKNRYELDIKSKLQAIANARPDQTEIFYRYKELIERNYLSLEARPIKVMVNEEPEAVDFDSYCQRIHFLEGNLIIEDVAIRWDGDSTRRRVYSLAIQQRQIN
jgi:hypothetical protein